MKQAEERRTPGLEPIQVRAQPCDLRGMGQGHVADDGCDRRQITGLPSLIGIQHVDHQELTRGSKVRGQPLASTREIGEEENGVHEKVSVERREQVDPRRRLVIEHLNQHPGFRANWLVPIGHMMPEDGYVAVLTLVLRFSAMAGG